MKSMFSGIGWGVLRRGRRKRSHVKICDLFDNTMQDVEEIEFDYLGMLASDGVDIHRDDHLCRENYGQHEDDFAAGLIPTDNKTDDDSLTGILGGPYQLQEQGETMNDDGVIYLKYAIKRTEAPNNVRVRTDNSTTRSRNPFKRILLRKAKPCMEPRKETRATLSARRAGKLMASKLFRRKKSRWGHDDSPSRSTASSESLLHHVEDPPFIIGSLDMARVDIVESAKPEAGDDVNQVSTKATSGRRFEWQNRNTNKKCFAMRGFKRKELKVVPKGISLCEKSDRSSSYSGAHSLESGSEIISFYSDEDSLDDDDADNSLFSDFWHTLDDLATFRFLSDHYDCAIYTEPKSRKPQKPKYIHFRSGYCKNE